MRLLLLCVLASVFYLQSNAQISLKTEYLGKSQYRVNKEDKDQRVGDSKGSAMVYQGGVNIPLSTKVDRKKRPTMWSISAGGAYAKLNNSNFTEPLVIDEIMNLGLSLNHLRPLSRKWSMMASVGGGVFMPSTRFSEIRFKNMLASGSVIFIHHFSPTFQLGGGVALNNSFGFPMAFPAIYLNWITQGRFGAKISLMEGLALSVNYDVSKNLRLNFVTEMSGQMALLEQEGKDKIFSHQYIVVGLRPEIRLGQRVTIPITMGISAMRPAEISSRNLKSMFDSKGYYFQVAPHVSAGLQIGF